MVLLLCVLQTRAKLNSDSVPKVMGNLLYHLATRFKGSKERASMLLDYIATGKVGTEQQLTGVVMATLECIGLIECLHVQLPWSFAR